jgi:hypothetical protein
LPVQLAAVLFDYAHRGGVVAVDGEHDTCEAEVARFVEDLGLLILFFFSLFAMPVGGPPWRLYAGWCVCVEIGDHLYFERRFYGFRSKKLTTSDKNQSSALIPVGPGDIIERCFMVVCFIYDVAQGFPLEVWLAIYLVYQAVAMSGLMLLPDEWLYSNGFSKWKAGCLFSVTVNTTFLDHLPPITQIPFAKDFWPYICADVQTSGFVIGMRLARCLA